MNPQSTWNSAFKKKLPWDYLKIGECSNLYQWVMDFQFQQNPQISGSCFVKRLRIYGSRHSMHDYAIYFVFSIYNILYIQYTQYTAVYCIFSIHSILSIHIGWLRLVGSLKLLVSFADYSLLYRALSHDIPQKRPVILRSLLIVATSQCTVYTIVYIVHIVYTKYTV